MAQQDGQTAFECWTRVVRKDRVIEYRYQAYDELRGLAGRLRSDLASMSILMVLGGFAGFSAGWQSVPIGMLAMLGLYIAMQALRARKAKKPTIIRIWPQGDIDVRRREVHNLHATKIRRGVVANYFIEDGKAIFDDGREIPPRSLLVASIVLENAKGGEINLTGFAPRPLIASLRKDLAQIVKMRRAG